MSSDKRKKVTEVDKQEMPDSTTKERINFYEGQNVFVSQKDGCFYFGTIVEICVSSEKSLVKFEDGTECWSPLKNLIRLSIPRCAVCENSQTKKNNDVVICEKCGRGYHQKCHQPIIESVKVGWRCEHCHRNKNCQLSVTKKTVYEDLSYDTTNNSATSDTQLPELPPTPPSSVSAPETPQPSIVNGEPPTSPIEDPCIDFNDTSTPNQVGNDSNGRCLNLYDLDLFSENKSNQPSISLPFRLSSVVTEPLVRPTKRRLSEKDIRINEKGEVKRRRIRRQSSLGHLKAHDVARPSTSKPSESATSVSAKSVPNGSSVDLKTALRANYREENKIDEENKLDRILAGEEIRICGKRVTHDGRVQYLVEWVKCTDPI